MITLPMVTQVALTVKRPRSTLIPPPREGVAPSAHCRGAPSQGACNLCLDVHNRTKDGKDAILSHHAHPR
jgi:hypothetical protein